MINAVYLHYSTSQAFRILSFLDFAYTLYCCYKYTQAWAFLLFTNSHYTVDIIAPTPELIVEPGVSLAMEAQHSAPAPPGASATSARLSRKLYAALLPPSNNPSIVFAPPCSSPSIV